MSLLLRIAFLIGPVFLTWSSLLGATPSRSTSQVESVLRAEGLDAVDRRQRLGEDRKRQPDSSLMHWHSGFVRVGKTWQAFDNLSAPPDSQDVREYRAERLQTDGTGPSQLKLAEWCRRKNLRDLERVHLQAALMLNPELITPQMLERLGYREIAGNWFSPEQQQEWTRWKKRATASIEKWQPRLLEAREKFAKSPKGREALFERLHRSLDASAVPAIHFSLTERDEVSAEFAVGLLKQIEGHEATQTLAGQGVSSQWPSIRKLAAQGLKGRRFEDFVPQLVGLLSTPVTSQLQVFEVGLHVGRNTQPGALYYQLIYARETMDQTQRITLSTANLMTDDYLPANPSGIDFVNSRLQKGRAEALRVIERDLDLQSRQLEDYNERIEDLNQRLGEVLATATGKSYTVDAAVWWSWWSEHTDTERVGSKPLAEYKQSRVVGSPRESNLKLRMDPCGKLLTLSCFRAGTPVWTESGMVPIEKVQMGDGVLSQDVETGELLYKRVIRTTVRPPHALFNVTMESADPETIACTGGHNFWVAGQGWVKARDLRSGTLVHTATNSIRSGSEPSSETAETYNLVIPDTHTYFVGRNAILVQDLLTPKPTDRRVPGLTR